MKKNFLGLKFLHSLGGKVFLKYHYENSVKLLFKRLMHLVCIKYVHLFIWFWAFSEVVLISEIPTIKDQQHDQYTILGYWSTRLIWNCLKVMATVRGMATDTWLLVQAVPLGVYHFFVYSLPVNPLPWREICLCGLLPTGPWAILGIFENLVLSRDLGMY